nr:MAG TPA: hypothetical protein [Bacteriophage sp.]
MVMQITCVSNSTNQYQPIEISEISGFLKYLTSLTTLGRQHKEEYINDNKTRGIRFL